MTPILDLTNDITKKYNPATLRFPNKASTNKLKGWATVLREVARWLSDNGHIMEQQQSNILRTKAHSESSHRPVWLTDDLYINLNIPAKNVLADMQKLLKDIDHEPRNFKIVLKDKIR